MYINILRRQLFDQILYKYLSINKINNRKMYRQYSQAFFGNTPYFYIDITRPDDRRRLVGDHRRSVERQKL